VKRKRSAGGRSHRAHRVRLILPEFYTDEKLSSYDVLTRFLYVALWTLADDAGRLVDDAKAIDAELFSRSPFNESCVRSLELLARESRIVRYTSTAGQPLIQVVRFHHQRVHNPSKTYLEPPMPELMKAALSYARRSQQLRDFNGQSDLARFADARESTEVTSRLPRESLDRHVSVEPTETSPMSGSNVRSDTSVGVTRVSTQADSVATVDVDSTLRESVYRDPEAPVPAAAPFTRSLDDLSFDQLVSDARAAWSKMLGGELELDVVSLAFIPLHDAGNAAGEIISAWRKYLEHHVSEDEYANASPDAFAEQYPTWRVR
jgi:hypothetical protein